MKIKLGILALVLALASPAMFAAPKKDKKAKAEKKEKVIDAAKLLADAEFIRNPQEDYGTTVKIEDVDKSKKSTSSYYTSVKGRDKALVKFTEPTTEIGKRVLMIDNDMWVYVPTAKKPLRISPRQKLAGNAAYGDVARLNYTGNYTATYKGEDNLEKTPVYVLDLVAIEGRPVTYDKVEYWVEKKTKKPLRALYKTISGKVIREGAYSDYKDVFGVQRPTKIVITDMIDTKHQTTLSFGDPTKEKLSDVMFQVQNLGKE